MMKIITSLKTLSACTLLLCSSVFAQTQLLDKLAAVVDDDVVMVSELQQRSSMILKQIQESGTQMPPLDVLNGQVLEQLIVESLQLQMGERAGLDIPNAQLTQAIEGMRAASGMSDTEFKAKLAQDHLSIAGLREQVRREMVIEEVQRSRVNRRIQVSQQEITNFLNSKQGEFWSSPDYKLGHILVGISAGANAEEVAKAKAKAEKLRQQVQAGADFREKAISHSKGQNALQGGDLDWRKSAQLPELFANALEDLNIGQVTPPLHSGAGFHLLKLYEKRGATTQLVDQALSRHILLKTSTILSDEQAQTRLKQLRQKIIAGEASFEDMAREHSEDIGSMLSGGSLGWSLPGKFVPAFEKAMEATDINEISQPFRSQFGWHILQVQERRQQDMTETVKRNQAANLIRSRRFEEERLNWLREIRDEAYVDIKL